MAVHFDQAIRLCCVFMCGKTSSVLSSESVCKLNKELKMKKAVLQKKMPSCVTSAKRRCTLWDNATLSRWACRTMILIYQTSGHQNSGCNLISTGRLVLYQFGREHIEQPIPCQVWPRARKFEINVDLQRSKSRKREIIRSQEHRGCSDRQTEIWGFIIRRIKSGI